MAVGGVGSTAKLRAESGWIEEAVERWKIPRESVNRFPKLLSEFKDLEKVIEQYIFSGYGPKSSLIRKQDQILTIGSCFAERLRRFLSSNGYRSNLIDVPVGLNNTFAVRQYIEWIVTGDRSSDAYWYDQRPDNKIIKWEPKDEQRYVLDRLRETSLIVLTIGLAEVWRDKESSNVFWRGVPCSLFDSDIHECVLSTVDENYRNLSRIYKLVNAAIPNASLVVTLSPVPMFASFQGCNAFSADCISKSILRIAISMLEAEKLPNFYYWPSFECVRWLGAHLNRSVYDGDNHPTHVSDDIVEIIVRNFIDRFCCLDDTSKNAKMCSQS